MTATGHEARAKAVLDNLRRRDTKTHTVKELPDELVAILAKMRDEIAALHARVDAANQSTGAASELSGGVLQLAQRMQSLETRLVSMEQVWSAFGQVIQEERNKRSAA